MGTMRGVALAMLALLSLAHFVLSQPGAGPVPVSPQEMKPISTALGETLLQLSTNVLQVDAQETIGKTLNTDRVKLPANDLASLVSSKVEDLLLSSTRIVKRMAGEIEAEAEAGRYFATRYSAAEELGVDCQSVDAESWVEYHYPVSYYGNDASSTPTISLSSSSVFPGISVSSRNNGVHKLPPSGSNSDVSTVGAICLMQTLDDSMPGILEAEGYATDNQKWIYFVHNSGVMRIYPAFQWSEYMSSSSYDPRLQDWYARATMPPKDIIFLLDISGSMLGEYSTTGTTFLNRAVEVVTQFVNYLKGDDRYSIILFNSNATILTGNTLISAIASNVDSSLDELANATDTSTLEEYYEKTCPACVEGNYELAFQAAFDVLSKSGSTVEGTRCASASIVLVSDGGASAGLDWSAIDHLKQTPTPLGAFIASEAERNNATVFAIGVGTLDDDDESVLREASCVGGGVWTTQEIQSAALEGLTPIIETLFYAKPKQEVPSFSNPYVDSLGLGLILTISYPAIYNTTTEDHFAGQLIGVAASDILMSDLLATVFLLNADFSYAFLINKYGEVLAHPKLNSGGNTAVIGSLVELEMAQTFRYNISATDFSSLVQGFLGGHPGAVTIEASKTVSTGTFEEGTTEEVGSFVYSWQPITTLTLAGRDNDGILSMSDEELIFNVVYVQPSFDDTSVRIGSSPKSVFQCSSVTGGVGSMLDLQALNGNDLPALTLEFENRAAHFGLEETILAPTRAVVPCFFYAALEMNNMNAKQLNASEDDIVTPLNNFYVKEADGTVVQLTMDSDFAVQSTRTFYPDIIEQLDVYARAVSGRGTFMFYATPPLGGDDDYGHLYISKSIFGFDKYGDKFLYSVAAVDLKSWAIDDEMDNLIQCNGTYERCYVVGRSGNILWSTGGNPSVEEMQGQNLFLLDKRVGMSLLDGGLAEVVQNNDYNRLCVRRNFYINFPISQLPSKTNPRLLSSANRRMGTYLTATTYISSINGTNLFFVYATDTVAPEAQAFDFCDQVEFAATIDYTAVEDIYANIISDLNTADRVCSSKITLSGSQLEFVRFEYGGGRCTSTTSDLVTVLVLFLFPALIYIIRLFMALPCCQKCRGKRPSLKLRREQKAGKTWTKITQALDKINFRGLLSSLVGTTDPVDKRDDKELAKDMNTNEHRKKVEEAFKSFKSSFRSTSSSPLPSNRRASTVQSEDAKFALASLWLRDAIAGRDIRIHRLQRIPIAIYKAQMNRWYERFILFVVVLHMLVIFLEPVAAHYDQNCEGVNGLTYGNAIIHTSWLEFISKNILREALLWFEVGLLAVQIIHVSLRMYSGGFFFYLSRGGSFFYVFCLIAMVVDVVLAIVYEYAILNVALQSNVTICRELRPPLTANCTCKNEFQACPVLTGVPGWRWPCSYPRFGRIFRALVLVTRLKSLSTEFRKLRRVIPKMVDVMILFFFVLVVHALLITAILRNYEGVDFRVFSKSLINLYVFVTGENHPDVIVDTVEVRVAVLVLLSLFVLGEIVAMSNAMAVIFDRFVEQHKREVSRRRVRERRALLSIFMCLDETGQGKMSYDTFVRLVKSVKPTADDTTLETVFNLTDKDHSKFIDPLEFFSVIDTINVEIELVNTETLERKRQKLVSRMRNYRCGRGCLRMFGEGSALEDFVLHRFFRHFSAMYIVMNAILQVMKFQRDDWSLYMNVIVFKWMDRVIILLFTLEVFLKLLGRGPKNFWRNKWNQADLIILIVTFVSYLPTLFRSIDTDKIPTSIFIYIRLVLILRVLRLFYAINRYNTFLKAFVRILPAVYRVVLLLIIIVYIYLVIGMEMFAYFYVPIATNNPDFNSPVETLLLLFQLITGEAWNSVMDNGVAAWSGWRQIIPYLFFLSFSVLVTITIMNLVVSVFLEYFSREEKEVLKELEGKKELQRSLSATGRGSVRVGNSKLVVRDEKGGSKIGIKLKPMNVNLRDRIDFDMDQELVELQEIAIGYDVDLVQLRKQKGEDTNARISTAKVLDYMKGGDEGDEEVGEVPDKVKKVMGEGGIIGSLRGKKRNGGEATASNSSFAIFSH